MQHRGDHFPSISQHMFEQWPISPPRLVPSSSTLMKACRYIQLPNLWCRRCIARECLGSNADRSVLVNQMLLQDWRHHGGYRCLVARLALHQYGKWRHSPERQYWLVMLVVDCVFKLLIMKPLAPGSMDMVVGETSRQRQQKAVKSTTACERWSQSLLSKLAEWEISDCGIVWSSITTIPLHSITIYNLTIWILNSLPETYSQEEKTISETCCVGVEAGRSGSGSLTRKSSDRVM